MVTPKWNTNFLIVAALFGLTVIAMRVPEGRTEETPRATSAEDLVDKRWQAVAPGQVEPSSGEIRIAAATVGRISEVLVKSNDTVFAGEPLIRLDDEEARARLAMVEAQVALRKRVRNDETASARAADRRRAEDSLADAERAFVEARAAMDKAAAARRSTGGADGLLDVARVAFSRTQDRLKQQQAELRRIEAQSNTPLPSPAEGQLNVARAELAVAHAVLEKMTIRAPIAGTVLQVSAKAGELATPSSLQPLVLLGDVSALRVRAELDERDFGAIKIGQSVLVRAAAFRERGFAGKVSSIAPLAEPGRINSRGLRNPDDKVVEVLVDLTDAGQLAVGMRVDVYFRYPSPPIQKAQ